MVMNLDPDTSGIKAEIPGIDLSTNERRDDDILKSNNEKDMNDVAEGLADNMMN